MALKAGRKGVRSDLVDAYGNLEIEVDPYELPVASPEVLGGVKPVSKTESMTQDVGVDSSGKLYVAPPAVSGTKIYYKDYDVNTSSISGVSLKTCRTQTEIGISGLTPVSAELIDSSTGYGGFAGVCRGYSNANSLHGFGIAFGGNSFKIRVYYVDSSNVESVPT